MFWRHCKYMKKYKIQGWIHIYIHNSLNISITMLNLKIYKSKFLLYSFEFIILPLYTFSLVCQHNEPLKPHNIIWWKFVMTYYADVHFDRISWILCSWFCLLGLFFIHCFSIMTARLVYRCSNIINRFRKQSRH